MVRDVAEGLYEELCDRFDEDLRSVAYYADGTWEIIHMRSDIENEYEDTDILRVFRNVQLEAIDSPHQESLYTHGELLCTVRCFENATEFHAIVSETSGVIAAVDAGAVDDLRETIATVESLLSSED